MLKMYEPCEEGEFITWKNHNFNINSKKKMNFSNTKIKKDKKYLNERGLQLMISIFSFFN